MFVEWNVKPLLWREKNQSRKKNRERDELKWKKNTRSNLFFFLEGWGTQLFTFKHVSYFSNCQNILVDHILNLWSSFANKRRIKTIRDISYPHKRTYLFLCNNGPSYIGADIHLTSTDFFGVGNKVAMVKSKVWSQCYTFIVDINIGLSVTVWHQIHIYYNCML